MSEMKLIMEDWRSFLNEATAVKYAAGGLGDPDKLVAGQVEFEWGTYTGRHSALDYYVADRMRGSLGPIQRRGDPYTYEQPEPGMLRVVSGPFENAATAESAFAAPAFPERAPGPGTLSAREEPPEGRLTDEELRAEMERIEALPPEQQGEAIAALQQRMESQWGEESTAFGAPDASDFAPPPDFSGLRNAGETALDAAITFGDARETWVRSAGPVVSYRDESGRTTSYNLAGGSQGNVRRGDTLWGMSNPNRRMTGFGRVSASNTARRGLQSGLPSGFLDAASEMNDTFDTWKSTLVAAIQEFQLWVRTNTHADLTAPEAPDNIKRAAKMATGDAAAALVEASISYINTSHPWIENEDQAGEALRWALGGAQGFQFMNQGIAILNLAALSQNPDSLSDARQMSDNLHYAL